MDVERLKEAGCHEKDFLELVNIELEGALVMRGSLKNREDGSCIFLKFDAERDRYECSIYDFRPILCRLYPFDFDKVGSNIFMLKFIPCCRGLNDADGKLVDEKFITSNLAVSLVEAIELF